MPQTLSALPAPDLPLSDPLGQGHEPGHFWIDLAQALAIAVLLVSGLFLIMGFLIMPGLPGA